MQKKVNNGHILKKERTGEMNAQSNTGCYLCFYSAAKPQPKLIQPQSCKEAESEDYFLTKIRAFIAVPFPS